MEKRIYVIKSKEGTRLIRAFNKLYAIAYYVKGSLEIHAIKKNEMEEHMKKGTKIEEAK